MKRVNIIILSILVCFYSTKSMATVVVDGICYSLTGFGDEAYAAVVKLNGKTGGYSGNIDIPKEVYWSNQKYVVNRIQNNAFQACQNLESVSIGSEVTSIGDYAFEACANLSSVKIGEKVKTIGIRAFNRCASLSSISIPNSVTVIRQQAFENCTNLASISIGSGLKKFGEHFTESGFTNVFMYCTNIESIEVDKNNAYFDSRNNCNAILQKGGETLLLGCKNTVIPYGVKTIYENAFFKQSELSEIVLPYGVETIEKWAFYGCTGMTKLTLPYSITHIDNEAFSACKNLLSVEFYCRNIGTWFKGFKSIEEIKIGYNVETISSSAFQGCTSISSVVLPRTLRELGDKAFYDCYNLQSVKFDNCCPTFGVNCFDIYYLKNIYYPVYNQSHFRDYFQLNKNEDIVVHPQLVMESEWSTLAFMDFGDYFYIPNEVKAFAVCGISGTEITLKRVYNTVGIHFLNKPAGGLIVYCPNPGKTYEKELFTPTIRRSWEDLLNNMLTGVFSDTTITATDGENVNFVMRQDNGLIKFCRVEEETISANEAYLQIPIDSFSANIPDVLSVVFVDEDVTSVNTVEKNTIDDERWFSLSGTSTKQPKRRGLYIHKGKKTIVK